MTERPYLDLIRDAEVFAGGVIRNPDQPMIKYGKFGSDGEAMTHQTPTAFPPVTLPGDVAAQMRYVAAQELKNARAWAEKIEDVVAAAQKQIDEQRAALLTAKVSILNLERAIALFDGKTTGEAP